MRYSSADYVSITYLHTEELCRRDKATRETGWNRDYVKPFVLLDRPANVVPLEYVG